MGLAEHPLAVGNVYNVGNDKEVSILDLARRVISLTGSESSIGLVPYEEAYEDGFEDMMRRVPDLSKLQRLVGYAPRYDLDTTLQSVIAHERATVRSSLTEYVVEAHP
jgi:UDP-glucose 4-epimerase